jgi:5'-nucleotidase (lipoprotein e(P4) family)
MRSGGYSSLSQPFYGGFMRIRLILFSLLLVVSGCTTPPPPAREDWRHLDVTTQHPVGFNTLWVAGSEGWKRSALRSYAQATRFVDAEAKRHKRGHWVVVMDLDQTVLNNITYHVAQDRAGAPFAPPSWRDWVEARSASAVPGAREFIRHARARGAQIAFVTNRRDYEEAATIDNLATLGLVKGRDYALLFTRAWPDGESEKDARYREVERILSEKAGAAVTTRAYIGDQTTDHPKELGKAKFFCIPQGNLYGAPCERAL